MAANYRSNEKDRGERRIHEYQGERDWARCVNHVPTTITAFFYRKDKHNTQVLVVCLDCHGVCILRKEKRGKKKNGGGAKRLRYI